MSSRALIEAMLISKAQCGVAALAAQEAAPDVDAEILRALLGAKPGDWTEITLRPGQTVGEWFREKGLLHSADNLDIPPSPVQQHVEAVIDDLMHGRLNPIQRGMLKRAMEDSAVSDLARGKGRVA